MFAQLIHLCFFGSVDICLTMLGQQRKLETGEENRKVMGNEVKGICRLTCDKP